MTVRPPPGTIRPPPDVQNEVHRRVERHFLQAVTRLIRDFQWYEELRKRLESMLQGRLAIYEQAKEEYMKERGPGLEAFIEEGP